MSVPTLPDVFRQLSCLADVRGGDESADLRSAAAVLERLAPAHLPKLLARARAGQPLDLPALSPAAIDRVRNVAGQGGDAVLEAARSRVPFLLRRLLEMRSVSCQQAVLLARELGIATLSDLQAALLHGHLEPGFGNAAGQLAGAAAALSIDTRPTLLGRAYDILTAVRESMAVHCPAFDEITIAGDARRFEPLVRELVLVGRTVDADAALAELAAMGGVDDVLYRAGNRAIISLLRSEIDIRCATPGDRGTVLFMSTGSQEHVGEIARKAPRPGPCASEADVYARVGLPWIPPEVRNGSGEIEAAGRSLLPRLVERADIRGDLHMHSTFSDGQDTLEAMITSAALLGYEYVAITDHSTSAAASR
ncbi:MAG: hypothetical protein H0W08_05785, partial [Acidobacteria bacterium]|nr:hypothetical protein [Acidobacteriota bacterium]